MKRIRFVFLSLTIIFLSACQAPNVSYFSDMGNGYTEQVTQATDIRLQSDDKISIVVNSKDPELSALFNLPVMTQRIGYSNNNNYNNAAQYMSVYTIDAEGNIDFPVLGRVKASGLRRDELAARIKNELVSRNLVKDPVLTVEYANLGFNVLGEVNRPGRYAFDRDHLTILDAISMAGDLTIQGRRQDILLIRGFGSERTTYRVNIQSGKELLQSPAFYLQQNDVVYVEPNSYRSRQTTVNGNNVLSAPFWISVASLLTSVAVLIFK